MVEVIKYSQSELSFILEGSFCFYLFAIFTKRLKKEKEKKRKNQYPGHERAIFYTIDVRVWRSYLSRERKEKKDSIQKKLNI